MKARYSNVKVMRIDVYWMTQVVSVRGKVEMLAVDVSSWEDVDRAVNDAVTAYGALHVMVNNAAIYTGTDLLATSQDD